MRTMTTLENSYCVPRTEEEWFELGLKPHIYADKSAVFWSKDNPYNNGISGPINPHLLRAQKKSKVSVDKFLDLIHDRIVPWRLEEVGFLSPFDAPIYRLLTPNHIIHVETRAESGGPFNPNDIVRVDGGETSITTFTELLTLIKLLTPPTKNA